jgi:hypothetical protein
MTLYIVEHVQDPWYRGVTTSKRQIKIKTSRQNSNYLSVINFGNPNSFLFLNFIRVNKATWTHTLIIT